MRITVSGAVGSGKSTVAKIVAKELDLTYFSMGAFMRDIAKKRDLTILEVSKRAEQDPTIDEELDNQQKHVGEHESDFIVDSRLGFHFIPDSFKIFLNVEFSEAARRIMGDKRAEEIYENEKQAIDDLKKRMRSENIRYKEYYGIDFPNRDDFDLIVDTTKKTPEEVAKEIIDAVKKGIN